MRRTDEDFKAEVFRRCEAYRARKRKHRRMVMAICLPLLMCSAALMMAISGGFGGSTKEIGADNAMSMECMDAPAAVEVEPEAPAAEAPAAEMDQSISGSSDGLGDNSDCNAVVLSITVTSQPEAVEYSRTFTDPEKIYAIMDAIQAFYDDPQTVPGGSEIGECEGMGFKIVVTEETITREYILFNNAITADGEGEWLVNPECCNTLEKLIRQEGD